MYGTHYLHVTSPDEIDVIPPEIRPELLYIKMCFDHDLNDSSAKKTIISLALGKDMQVLVARSWVSPLPQQPGDRFRLEAVV